MMSQKINLPLLLLFMHMCFGGLMYYIMAHHPQVHVSCITAMWMVVVQTKSSPV